MSNAHRRKKQPAEVRRQLLDVAARLCLANGLQALTLDAVAREAGVSKGGLLHHFPGKQALIEALSDTLLEDAEQRINAEIATDDDPNGRFTRAYLMANIRGIDGAEDTETLSLGATCCDGWVSLAILLMAEETMRSRWHAWLAGRLGEQGEADRSLACQIVRLAADGLWLADYAGGLDISPREREELVGRLIAMTRSPATPDGSTPAT